MKLFVTMLVLTLSAAAQAPAPNAQPAPPQVQVQVTNTQFPANPADVKSAESIIHAVYDVISGPAGQTRDWNRFQSLFIPGARLIPTFKRPPDAPVFTTRVLSPEEFATNSQRAVQSQGFFEKEIARRTEQWGNIAQVFSTYESRHAAGDQPFARGINSFQLLNDGQRWWIVTIFWQGESKDVPLTPEFLK